MPVPRTFATSNPVLEAKWHEESMRAHHRRMQDIFESGSSLPRSKSSSLKMLPRSQTPSAKTRRAEIAAENLRLVQRIMNMDQHQDLVPPNQSSSKKPSVPSKASHPMYTKKATAKKHSMSRFGTIQYKEAQQQLDRENVLLRGRIEQTKSCFDRRKWQKEEQRRKKYLLNASRIHEATLVARTKASLEKGENKGRRKSECHTRQVHFASSPATGICIVDVTPGERPKSCPGRRSSLSVQLEKLTLG